MYKPLCGCKSDSKELPVERYKVPVDKTKVRKIDANTICFGFFLTKLETFFKSLMRVLFLLRIFICILSFNSIRTEGMNVRVNTYAKKTPAAIKTPNSWTIDIDEYSKAKNPMAVVRLVRNSAALMSFIESSSDSFKSKFFRKYMFNLDNR
jgi:hypothetical protein